VPAKAASGLFICYYSHMLVRLFLKNESRLH